MAIAFNQIPVILRTPGSYTEYDASRAIQGLAALPSRILVVGSMFAPGGSVEGSALTLYPIFNNTEGDRLFGVGSQLARMLKKLKAANAATEVFAVGAVDDGAGVAATKTITITGTATEDGVLNLLVAGQRMPVAVSDGDTETTVAAAVAAALSADAELPFTGGSVAGVATATARHAAAFTEDLDIRLNFFDRERTPAGITVAIADGVTGATNPDAATVIAVIPEEFYTTLITGWNDAANMALLETEALRRWGPLVQRDMHIIAGVSGDFSALTTYGASRNSQFSSAVGPGLTPNPDYEVAAVLGAVEEAEPDPARPRQTLRLPGLFAPSREDQFLQSERNLLLQQGIATLLFDQSGAVFIERLITTYQTNALGSDDPTFLDITTLRTLSALRFTLNARINLKYPRHKLASDGKPPPPPGQPIVTPNVIRGEIIALYTDWSDQGWVESSALGQFMEELLVQRNGSDVNRVDALIPPDIINQFRVFAGQIQFLL